MPCLARIRIYPIKSLDGVDVTESGFVEAGGLRHDRRFALRTRDGHWVNAKRFPAILSVRAQFDLAAESVELARGEESSAKFALRSANAELTAWFGDYLHQVVELVEDIERGIPDDFDSPGPTIVSAATLREVADWFPPLTVEEVRRRFRANLELEADANADDPCPPFWEDRLFAEDAAQGARNVVPFRIGDVRLQGVNPCARCPVPTRDSHTGEVWPKFGAEFAARRERSLPAWAPRSAFDHFYRLAVNTRVPSADVGKTIRLGDRVVVL